MTVEDLSTCAAVHDLGSGLSISSSPTSTTDRRSFFLLTGCHDDMKTYPLEQHKPQAVAGVWAQPPRPARVVDSSIRMRGRPPPPPPKPCGPSMHPSINTSVRHYGRQEIRTAAPSPPSSQQQQIPGGAMTRGWTDEQHAHKRRYQSTCPIG